MKYHLIEQKDMGNVRRASFDTLEAAENALETASRNEDERWELVKKRRPNIPREALSYFHIEKTRE